MAWVQTKQLQGPCKLPTLPELCTLVNISLSK